MQYYWATNGQLLTAKGTLPPTGRCWQLGPYSLVGGKTYTFEVQAFEKNSSRLLGVDTADVMVISEGVQAVLSTNAAVSGVTRPIKIDGRKSKNLDDRSTGRSNMVFEWFCFDLDGALCRATDGRLLHEKFPDKFSKSYLRIPEGNLPVGR